MISKVILITGGAGFIGFHTSLKMLEEGYQVIGFDNLNDYYDVHLKEDRLEILKKYDNYTFIQGDLVDENTVNQLFENYNPDIVIHLGAQAGVRYSIENPRAYLDSNVIGFFNILEACRRPDHPIDKLVFASSSSIYGLNQKVPYSVEDKVDTPISFYAATKKSDELMAHAYSKIYGMQCIGLRFFTVYGPFGRPDMAYFKFANKLVKGESIQVYNNGDMYRDFTYIDDVVKGLYKIVITQDQYYDSDIKYKIYNIGNNKPQSLMDFIHVLERSLIKHGITIGNPIYEFMPMQQGDVYQTYADVDDLIKDFGYCPSTSIEEGLDRFAEWYANYYLKDRKHD